MSCHLLGPEKFSAFNVFNFVCVSLIIRQRVLVGSRKSILTYNFQPETVLIRFIMFNLGGKSVFNVFVVDSRALLYGSRGGSLCLYFVVQLSCTGNRALI